MDNSFINPLLKKLNKEQKEAVTHTEGPNLIIAGAGTGKTSVITTKIAYILSKELAKPEEILALTFTEKAAEEMQTRLDTILPFSLGGINTMTFHSFGDELIKENSFSIGLTSNYKLLSKAEEIHFFKENIFNFNLNYYRPLSNPTKFIDAILTFFSRLKDEDISKEDYEAFLQKLNKYKEKDNPYLFDSLKTLEEYISIQKELYDTFIEYENLKMNEAFLNFSDLIYLPLQILNTKPVIREYYQNKYKYILVDEYQDTNFAQNEILKIIAEKHKNLCVCGDDDQSIYKFRGASISNILEFENYYTHNKKFVLNINYRSNQSILDTSYNLIQNNNPDRLEVKANINKKLLSTKDTTKESVFVIECNNLNDEMDYVCKKIISIKEENEDITNSDFAVLIRSNSQAQPLIRELNINNIPFKYQGNTGLYETNEIRLLLSFLYSIIDPLDNLNLYNLSSSEIYAINMKALIACNNQARSISKPLSYIYSKIDEFIDVLNIDEESIEKIKIIVSDIEKYSELSREQNIGIVLYTFLNEKGYLEKLTKEERITEIENIQKFFQRIDRFIMNTNSTSIQQFCDYIDYTREIGDEPISTEIEIEKDAVNILTIHRAKGMEFHTVFMIDLIDGRFPSREMRDPIEIPQDLIKEKLPSKNFHKEEERRLFYVGMTRAQENLFLLWAKDYYQKTQKKASPFLKEIDLNKPNTEVFIGNNKREENKKIENPISKNERKQIINLTQTKIQDYLDCPLKYEYNHKLHLRPQENISLNYGSLIHKVIEQILKSKINNSLMTKKEALEYLNSEWKENGFLSEEHKERTFTKATNNIVEFLEIQKSLTPLFIEKNFSIKFDTNTIVEGRWDLIETGKNIIDFKTSSVKDEKEATRKLKENLQLKIYAWAYYKTFGDLPKKIELIFLEKNIRVGYEPNEKTLKQAEESIQKVVDGLNKADYEANPSYMACSYCPFNKICPYTAIK